MRNRLTAAVLFALCASIALSPAVLASGEDVQAEKTDSPAPAKKAEAADPKTETEKPKADATPAATSPEKEGEATPVHPSFNTIEDVLAYQGSIAGLWADAEKVEPVVTWRTVEAPEKR